MYAIRSYYAEGLDADLRPRLATDLLDAEQRLLQRRDRLLRVVAVGDADRRFDYLVGEGVEKDFADDVLVGDGDDLAVLGGEGGGGEADFLDDAGMSLDVITSYSIHYTKLYDTPTG